MTTMTLLVIRMEALLGRHEHLYRMPAAVGKDFKNCIRGFVQTCGALAHHFHPRHVVLFNFTIKCHYAIHLGLFAEVLNVRMAWCYAGEDLMQKVKGILKKCHYGTPMWHVPNKAMHKYAQGLGMALQRSKLR